MSAGVRDIVQLKLQKKLLEEQLNHADHKIQRLGDILVKKTSKNPELLQPENNTEIFGRTLSDLRKPINPIRAIPKQSTYDVYSMPPVPVTNERILSIRQQFLIHTTGRNTVQKKIQAKKERELKSMKKEKKAPNIKVPDSMLPNRYVRGELPCTIGKVSTRFNLNVLRRKGRARGSKWKILKLGVPFRKLGL
jgi:hypothetical protein